MNAEMASIQPASKAPVVLLVGPTAVGKTEISLDLAQRLGAEIVSVDSRLFYRGMDIGTAKPRPEQLARVPHHLINLVRPDETLSLADFQRLAHAAIREIGWRGRLPLLVGGTGQYIRAVRAGWRPPRVEPKGGLRLELERLAATHGKHWLHERLAVLDPYAAATIDARNTRRTIRALEVILSTGKQFSEQRGREEAGYAITLVGLMRPRAELYERIDKRIDEMWRDGILEETRDLLGRGYSPDLPAMSAIGYSQCVKVIRGEWEPEQARADMRRATRAFVRRQANWFKAADPEITWFEAGEPQVISRLEQHIREAVALKQGHGGGNH